LTLASPPDPLSIRDGGGGRLNKDMIATGNSKIGSMLVGEARLDPAAIWGEGGWSDPRLVVPVEIMLNPRPEEHQLALIRITGSLSQN